MFTARRQTGFGRPGRDGAAAWRHVFGRMSKFAGKKRISFTPEPCILHSPKATRSKPLCEQMIEQPDESLLLDAVGLERDRIARELHDGVGQLITAARLLIDANDGNGPLVSSLLADATWELSRICTMLDTVSPLREGLGRALSELANRTSVLAGVTCTFACSQMISDQDHAALQVYRVAQEAVNNAIRHGGSTELSVALGVTEEQMALTVTDNGRWSAPDVRVEHRGLANMTARAASIGGKLRIRPGDEFTSTSVTLTVPRRAAGSLVNSGDREIRL